MTLGFAVVFLVQLCSLVHSALYPTELYTTMRKEPLTRENFPLTFKLCVTPGFNETALYEAGYDSAYHYNMGWSRFNGTFGGWAGHTLDGGTLNATGNSYGRIQLYFVRFTDIFYRGVNAEKLSDFLASVWTADSDIDINSKYIWDVDSFDPKMTTFMDKMCFTLRNTSMIASKELFFMFKQDTGLNEAELFILNSNQVVARTILEQHLYFLGPQMKVDLTNKTASFAHTTYNFALTQTVYDEDDKSKNCAIYPTPQYVTYGDCDKAYVEQILDGIVPIWATDNISTVTAEYQMPNTNIYLHNGGQVSPCKVPCTNTKGAYSASSGGAKMEFNGMLLYFREEMQVTQLRESF
jgi:hypothetical protein